MAWSIRTSARRSSSSAWRARRAITASASMAGASSVHAAQVVRTQGGGEPGSVLADRTPLARRLREQRLQRRPNADRLVDQRIAPLAIGAQLNQLSRVGMGAHQLPS